jgi:RimJ/RimL family protein N-acetyltransferase
MKLKKIEIRPFKFGDYIRFLKVRISPRTRKEFARSVLGYFVVALKDASSRIKAYKFSVYYNDRFVGFAGIFNDKGFDELAVFILPNYRGKGIATQTIKELIDYSFNKLKYKKINAVTDELRVSLEKILKNYNFKLVKKMKQDEREIKLWEKKK